MSFPSKPRIAIVGAGAIGNYFGACLAHAGHDVHFLLRRDYESARAHGISVYRRHAEDFTVNNVQAYRSTGDIGPCDLVLIALKGTQNDALTELLPPLIGPETVITTLQNGLGNVAFLQEHFPPEQVTGGLCFLGLNRDAHGNVHSFTKTAGGVIVGEPEGPASERVKRIAGLIDASGIPCRPSDNLLLDQWRKLVWNIPFNGLTIAAGGITTEALLQQQALRDAALGLMREVQAAAGAQELEISDDFLEKQFHTTENIGPYKPSTLIDFIEGRSVEVEAIFGEPLRRGKQSGVEMPRLQQLYGLLTSLAAERPAWKSGPPDS